jgi:hypothetical protein
MAVRQLAERAGGARRQPEMGEVLLDGEASYRAPLSPVAILEVGARSIKTEKLVLDVDREIAEPSR